MRIDFTYIYTDSLYMFKKMCVTAVMRERDPTISMW